MTTPTIRHERANARTHENTKTRKHEKGLRSSKQVSWFRGFVFSWLFLVMASVGVFAQPPAAPPSAPASGNAQTGKELYAKYSCYACHGYDGHGGAGARLVPLRMNLPGFAAYIKNPRQMPPYTAKVLSDAQAADLWAFIKAMPESPAADKIPLLSRIINEK
jgi:mono/diheme cytochrome c family protein